MTHKQANDVKDLAAPVNKALERLEWICPICKGKGKIWLANYLNQKNCRRCNSTGKIPYSWQPQVGEWCILKAKPDNIHLVSNLLPFSQDFRIASGHVFPLAEAHNKFIPILEWEEIERILEKAGYWIWLKRNGKKWEAAAGRGGIDASNRVFGKDSRQQAVMDAVRKLGKEML